MRRWKRITDGSNRAQRDSRSLFTPAKSGKPAAVSAPANSTKLANRAQWTALRSVAVVEAERQSRGQTTRERRHYLSSLPPHAPELARAIRGHWGIENPATGA